MIDRLEQMEQHYNDLQSQFALPEVVSDHEKYQKIAKAVREIEAPVEKYRELKQVRQGLADARAMLAETDADLRAMAQEEIAALEPRELALEEELKVMLLPKDPNDEKNIILEIRAGTGGDEASLFAAEIFRMYTRFAEQKRWKVEVMSISESGIGGYKEVIAIIEGDRVYSQLKWESGVHRVQRVPETEQQGRVHTSAITVAVLPEAEEVDIKIEAKDHPHRHFLLFGPRRPVGQHHLLRRAHHPPAHQHRGQLPGREVADQEPRKRPARAALALLRDGNGKAERRARPGPQTAGRLRRSQRKDPHLQLSAESRHRPPHRPHAAPARSRDAGPSCSPSSTRSSPTTRPSS